MEIKSLAWLPSLKTGKFSDVKNIGSTGFMSDETQAKAKDQFSTILAEEDTKNLPLSTEDSNGTLTAGDLPQPIVLTLPVAVLFSAPPLVLAGNTSFASGDLVNGGVAQNKAMMGRVEDVRSAPPAADFLPSSLIKPEGQPVLAPAGLQGFSAPKNIDPSVRFVSDISLEFGALSPTKIDQFSNALAPQVGSSAPSLHENRLVASDAMLTFKPMASPVETNSTHPISAPKNIDPSVRFVSDISLEFGALPLTLAPKIYTGAPSLDASRPAALEVMTNVEQRSRISPPSGDVENSIHASLPEKSMNLSENHLIPMVRKNVSEVDQFILNRSPEKSKLDEAGRKNEALLDVLALGDGRAKPVGDESDIKPVVYTFQREAVSETTFLNQSSSTSQTLATESSQVFEKNNFWGVSGPQNIALTLGGLGDETVAVKILVSGLDTQVDIRTDDQVLRQMIEGSVQEMKEKLSTEGLTLSGLSVAATSQEQGMGQSAGHGAGRESQRRAVPDDFTPQNSAQTTGFEKRVSSTESRPTSVGGRKLSVFV